MPRALVLAGGTVALTTVARYAVVRRRRRRCEGSRRPSLHLVPAVAAVGLSAGIVPDSLRPDWGFFSGFAGFILSGFGWITSAISSAVEFAVNWALKAVQAFEWVFDQVTDNLIYNVGQLTTQVAGIADGVMKIGYRVTVGLAEQGRDLLAQMGNLLEHVATDAFNLLKPYVDMLLQNVLEPGIDAIEAIVRRILGPAWDLITGLIELGADGVGVLLQLASDPIGTIWGWISGLVDQAIEETVAGIRDVLDLIQSIWHILEWMAVHAAELTTEVLEQAWKLFVWVVEHTDDFTVASLNAIFDPSWETLRDGVIAEAEAQMSGAEQFVASIFGLD